MGFLSNLVGGATSAALGGVSPTSVLTGGFASQISTIQNTLSSVGLGSAFSSTIGAVLGNGLNLSCWGASLTPSSANNNIKVYYTPYFAYLFQQVQNAPTASASQTALNQLLQFAYITEAYYRLWKLKQADWSSCAQKAINNTYKPFFTEMKKTVDSLKEQMIAKGATVTTQDVKARYTIPKSVTGKSDYTSGVNKDTNTVAVPVLNLSGVSLPSTGNGSTAPVEQQVKQAIEVVKNETKSANAIKQNSLETGGKSLPSEVDPYIWNLGELDNVEIIVGGNNPAKPKEDTGGIPWWLWLVGGYVLLNK